MFCEPRTNHCYFFIEPMNFRIPFVLIVASFMFVLSGCEKEMLSPEEGTPEVALSATRAPIGHCGTIRTSNLVDAQAHALADVQVMNTDGEIYLLIDMHTGFFLDQVKVYFGKTAGLPTKGNQIQMEDFQFQANTHGKTAFTIRQSVNGLPTCNDLVMWAQVSQRDMFGNVVGQQSVWLEGTPIYNGQYFEYCYQSCSNLSAVIR